MKGVAFWFFASAVVYVCLGMVFGIDMAIRNDFTYAPAHAHLNLVGWVTMGLFGIYYHLVPRAAGTGLARLHFGVATLGLWCMVPGIALAIADRGEALVAIGSLLTLAAMLIFLVTVIRTRAA